MPPVRALENIHALLPLYMATVMGASTFVIGVVEVPDEELGELVTAYNALGDLLRRERLEGALHLVEVFMLVVALDDVAAAVTETLLGNV